MRLHQLAAPVTALLLIAGLAGCGSGTKADAATNPQAAAMAAAGCPAAVAQVTEEMFVRALYACNGNSLYVFDSSSARDNWSKFATQFGGVELKRGTTWLLVKA